MQTSGAPRTHLIFDLGGVLLRWRPAALLARALPERAPTPEAAEALVREFFQGYGGDWGEFDRGAVEVDDLCGRIARRTHLGEHEVRRVLDAIPGELQPIEATVAWLARLRDAGHRLFYLSNMPAPFADHLERTHEFFSHFESGVFSARLKLVKPEPEIFQQALGRFGVAVGDCVFLDDHAPNVHSARAVGLKAVLFRDAAQAEAELRASGLL